MKQAKKAAKAIKKDGWKKAGGLYTLEDLIYNHMMLLKQPNMEEYYNSQPTALITQAETILMAEFSSLISKRNATKIRQAIERKQDYSTNQKDYLNRVVDLYEDTFIGLVKRHIKATVKLERKNTLKNNPHEKEYMIYFILDTKAEIEVEQEARILAKRKSLENNADEFAKDNKKALDEMFGSEPVNP
jgi:hypothetical protein